MAAKYCMSRPAQRTSPAMSLTSFSSFGAASRRIFPADFGDRRQQDGRIGQVFLFRPDVLSQQYAPAQRLISALERGRQS